MACHKIKINKRLINNNSIVYALMAYFFHIAPSLLLQKII